MTIYHGSGTSTRLFYDTTRARGGARGGVRTGNKSDNVVGYTRVRNPQYVADLSKFPNIEEFSLNRTLERFEPNSHEQIMDGVSAWIPATVTEYSYLLGEGCAPLQTDVVPAVVLKGNNII